MQETHGACHQEKHSSHGDPFRDERTDTERGGFAPCKDGGGFALSRDGGHRPQQGGGGFASGRDGIPAFQKNLKGGNTVVVFFG